ncbi:MAG: hypothetical protein MHMPM18_004117 [Marteilia pararefringens]
MLCKTARAENYRGRICQALISTSIEPNQAIQAIMLILAMRLLCSVGLLMRIENQYTADLDLPQAVRATWDGSGKCSENFDRFYSKDDWDFTSKGLEEFVDICLIDISTITNVKTVLYMNLFIIIVLISVCNTEKAQFFLLICGIILSSVAIYVTTLRSVNIQSENQFMRKFLVVNIDEIKLVHGIIIVFRCWTLFVGMTRVIIKIESMNDEDSI